MALTELSSSKEIKAPESVGRPSAWRGRFWYTTDQEYEEISKQGEEG